MARLIYRKGDRPARSECRIDDLSVPRWVEREGELHDLFLLSAFVSRERSNRVKHDSGSRGMHGSSPKGNVPATRERSGVIALVFVVIHAAIWLGCFIVAAAITEVTRAELIEAALPLGPLSLRYMQFANLIKSSHPLALLGLGVVAAVVDFATLYAIGGRSRLAEVARGLWSTLVSVVPLILLALALIALDLPFRAITMSRSKVIEHERQVENHLKNQLVGTWLVTGIRKSGEAATTTRAPMTVTFSQVKGTYPNLRADSSDQSILMSGSAIVTYRGNGACLHLGDGKQLCLAPLEPGQRMTLWAGPPGASAAPNDHEPTENLSVLTLVKRPGEIR